MAYTSNIYGALQIPDDDYTWVRTYGQEAIYDATIQLLGNHNADLEAFESIFVERVTDAHTAKFYLDTGGRLQKLTEKTRSANTKAAGTWTVALPLEEWGDSIAGDRVQMAYMTTRLYGLHIQQVLNSDINTRRHEMLKRLFNNGGGSPITFNDPLWGSLNIQPLANGDSTYYPPVVGSEINATHDNYMVRSYTQAQISDTNDPITPIVNRLRSYMGFPTGGSNIAVFGNQSVTDYIVANMTLFNPLQGMYQKLGDNITQAVNWPSNLPGEVLGTFGGKALIVHWEWIPDNYLLAVHLDAQPPLWKRVDPAGTGLGTGLQLIQQKVDQPLLEAQWSNRFGYAVGNRLNGIVLELNQGGSYAVPTGFSD
jgi:hypothetical protein